MLHFGLEVGAIKKFKERVWTRHDRSDSVPGRVYRSLQQIRFAADPNWDVSGITITLVAILNPEAEREVSNMVIKHELDQQISKIRCPLACRGVNSRCGWAR